MTNQDHKIVHEIESKTGVDFMYRGGDQYYLQSGKYSFYVHAGNIVITVMNSKNPLKSAIITKRPELAISILKKS